MSDTDSDSDIVKDFLVESYENLDRLLASKTGPVAAAGGALVTKRCATSGATRKRMPTAIFSHDSHSRGGLPPRMTTGTKLGPTASTFFWPSASPSLPP
jgi:hypothetical protein